jgi:spermidine synthase
MSLRFSLPPAPCPLLARLCLVVLLAATSSRAFGQQRAIYTTASAFNTIQVFEDEPRHLRYLAFGTGTTTQSVVKLGDPTHLELAYAPVMVTGLALTPKAQRVLIVGLGGGSLPMFFRHYYPDLEIDVVELDPAVASVARRFFEFREDAKLRVHVQDGRRFIEECRRPYDVIFLDAYGADDIPYSLITQEFLRAVRRAVAPGGLVTANIWGPPHPWYDGIVRTYFDVFDSLSIVHARNRGNEIFLAGLEAKPLDREQTSRVCTELSRSKSFPFDLGELVAEGFFQPDKEGAAGKVLLDADRPTEKEE